MEPDEIALLFARAAAGDKASFDVLVRRLAGVVWSVVRAHRLSGPDAEDVVQGVWLRLTQHLGSIRQPERLPGWLATTARHECLAVMRRHARDSGAGPVTDGVDAVDGVTETSTAVTVGGASGAGIDVVGDAVGVAMEDSARRRAVRAAMDNLDSRCRELLALLAHVPPVTYQDISESLGMPVASIGPTRGRCLDKIRRHPAVRAMIEGD
jgi:RNA polymerase sigma factor (sigma-70 family)